MLPKLGPFCHQATPGIIRLMTSWCILLHCLAVFACRKWRKVFFRSIDHCILCWPCCWARCWNCNNLTAKHYHTRSAGMEHCGGHSPAENTDSIIALRLDECTCRIVNDRTDRRDNIVNYMQTWQPHLERDSDKSTWRSRWAGGM